MRYLLFLLCLLVEVSAWGKEELLQPKREAYPVLAKRIQSWIQQLAEDNPKNPAGDNLLSVGSISYPYLFQALQSANSVTHKNRIIIVLRDIQDKNCVPVLVKCLENTKEDPRVRAEAAGALEKFPSTEVLQTLGKYAFDPDTRISRSVCYTLIGFSSKSAIPHWIQLLKHWDKEIRYKTYGRLVEATGRPKAPSEFTDWQQWWTDYKDSIEE